MSNPNKDAGTDWERRVADYLHEHHNPGVRRTGHLGPVDVSGYYLHVVEAKAERGMRLADYIRQANRYALQAGQPFACVWVKARGKGPAGAYVVRDGATDARLVTRLQAMEEALCDQQFDWWAEIDRELREGPCDG